MYFWIKTFLTYFITLIRQKLRKLAKVGNKFAVKSGSA